MGGSHRKPLARDTREDSSHGTDLCSRLGGWKLVTRTVNDLYQDGKHGFSFSPNTNYNNNVSGSCIEDNSTVNRRYSDGQTPLTSMIRKGNIEDVRDLLSQDVDVNYPEAHLYGGYRWDYYPPLIVAINCDNSAMVRLLLSSEASVNCTDSQGFTALYYAAKLGNKDIVSLLLSYSPTLVAPPVVEAYTVTDPLQIACCNGHLEVAKLLIKAGCEVNPDEEINPENGISRVQSPLHHALDSENEDLCLLLLQSGAKVTHTLFHKACLYGCEQTVKYMIDSGTNVNATSEHHENALMYALSGGGIQRLRRKLAYITDVESAKCKAREILQRESNMLHLLCENGCDLGQIDNWKTAIYRSWQNQNLPAVIVFLKHGAWFHLNDRSLNITSVNDEVFDELCGLYLTFVAPRIPEEVIHKRFPSVSPDSTKYSTPTHVTSLQHLCRFTLRNTLKSNRNYSRSIIIDINKMAIPPRLKRYLSYGEIIETTSAYCDKLFRLSWTSNCWYG